MDNVRAAGRLAYVASCRSCTAEIYVAVCTDGFWRVPSPDEIERARSVRGGWIQATLAAWGVPWPPPKGWREELVARWHNLV